MKYSIRKKIVDKVELLLDIKKLRTVDKYELLIKGTASSGKCSKYIISQNNKEIIMDSVSITKIQYEIMLKTIGFNRELLNNNEFKMWKNVFQQKVNIVDPDWIKLINLEFGEELNTVRTHVNYRVTKKGIDYIAEKEGFKVNYNDFFKGE